MSQREDTRLAAAAAGMAEAESPARSRTTRPQSTLQPLWKHIPLEKNKALSMPGVTADLQANLLPPPGEKKASATPGSFHANPELYGRTSLRLKHAPASFGGSASRQARDHVAVALDPPRFEPPARSRMKQIRTDKMLRQDTKEFIAARVIGRGLRAIMEHRKQQTGISRSAFVKKRLNIVSRAEALNMQDHFSAVDARERMAHGTMWRSLPPTSAPPSEGFGEAEHEFLSKVGNLAPDVRAHFYFNQSIESEILKQGHLTSFARRRSDAQDDVQSGTTAKNVTDLANHDHVFFFLAHKDAPWKPGRFGSESSESGRKKVHNEGALDGTERRLSFPLSAITAEGVKLMPNDHLGADRAKAKNQLLTDTDRRTLLSPGDEITDRRERAQFLLYGLATTALTRVANDPATKAKMLRAEGAELMSYLNYHTQRPQLMLPGSVSLHTEGTELHRAKATSEG